MLNVDHADQSGIPISVSLNENLTQQNLNATSYAPKKRLLFISALAVIIGICIAFIAKVLVLFINLITNVSFYHTVSISPSSPANNHLGLFVVIIPAIGGVV